MQKFFSVLYFHLLLIDLIDLSLYITFLIEKLSL